MLQDEIYRKLKIAGWSLFTIMLVINLTHGALEFGSRLITHTMPFSMDSTGVTDCADAGLAEQLNRLTRVTIDSLELSPDSVLAIINEELDDSIEIRTGPVSVDADWLRNLIKDKARSSIYDKVLESHVTNRDSILISGINKKTGEEESFRVATKLKLDPGALGYFFLYCGFLFIIYLSVFLLLRFSNARENILIAFFMLLMAAPSPEITGLQWLDNIWDILLAPFWGVMFYHFITLKIPGGVNLKKIYRTTAILNMIMYAAQFVSWLSWLSFMSVVWPVFWLFRAFFLMRRGFKNDPSDEVLRLQKAFRGITITVLSSLICAGILLATAIFVPVAELIFKNETLTEVIAIIFGVSALLAGMMIFVGLLWFFISFAWGLLTGSGLDVRIRSSVVFSIIGLVFIGVFGFINYAIGEWMESALGAFIGSEFIAGIPATLVLVALFDPLKRKIEHYVDRKLNPSSLDFLETTDLFADDLSRNGIAEGFENYLLDNLYNLLDIKKVALISLNHTKGEFIFNEIRGSDITENSPAVDSRGLLRGEFIQNEDGISCDNIADVASFSLIFPVIWEQNGAQWYLAFGAKNDSSYYNKNDLKSINNLVEKVRHSLQFILAYQTAVQGKYATLLDQKEDLIRQLNQEKEVLARQLKTFRQETGNTTG